MRRIAPIWILMGLGMLSGCGSRHYYRNVGVGQPAQGPSLETRVDGGIASPVIADETAQGTGRLSRDAVPDSVMLRDQAEAGFRDSQVPQ